MDSDLTLYEEVSRASACVQADNMGGSPVSKCYQMAFIAQKLSLKTYVEIGVYRGKSLFSVAPAFKKNNGKCYGIDPYCSHNFKETDTTEEIQKCVENFSETTDFDELYHDVLKTKIDLEMDELVTILRETSENAYPYFQKKYALNDVMQNRRTFIDMLHIDGNHDYIWVKKDAELYIPAVNEGGVIVFDDINWEGVRRVYEQVKSKFDVLYENGEYGILYKNSEGNASGFEEPRIRLLKSSLSAVYESTKLECEITEEKRKPKILAAVMCYNQGIFIEQCIRSILAQKGHFDITIGIFDDASVDDTMDVCRAIEDVPDNMRMVFYPNVKNTGYEENYLRVFEAVRQGGYDYFSIIDGDDYLCDDHRFEKHTALMSKHPEYALTFNRLKFYYEESGQFEDWRYQDTLSRMEYDAFDLADDYFIGNGSCSMVRSAVLPFLKSEYYTKAKIGDWFTHCIYAMAGDIGYIPDIMNVYRKHNKGTWSGLKPNRQSILLREKMLYFNKISNNLFYENFYDFLVAYNRQYLAQSTQLHDLVILDDVFPHPVSGFRMEEYLGYLRNIPDMQIWCNGGSSCALGKISHARIMAEFKSNYPEFADRLIEDKHVYERPYDKNIQVGAKLAYLCFLGNAYTSLELLEWSMTPFVFELYPGGGFAINSEKSDRMLERVCKSPCFRKVIVTQDITKNYLLDHGFCREDQIEEIFGVVTPEETLKQKPNINVSGNLKVCFAAMRYTPDGRDKGYDTFLKTAEKLLEYDDTIEFHVAGGFDENVIPLDKLEGKIHFHGILKNSELRTFMKDMDIIVSANRVGQIAKGAFDGFPTGTCTEAGLNGTLIVCTDPLHLNNGRFKNHSEIEIVDDEPEKIANVIAYYNEDRDALKRVVMRQYARIQTLYSIKKQEDSRLEILRREISRYERNRIEILIQNSAIQINNMEARLQAEYECQINAIMENHQLALTQVLNSTVIGRMTQDPLGVKEAFAIAVNKRMPFLFRKTARRFPPETRTVGLREAIKIWRLKKILY